MEYRNTLSSAKAFAKNGKLEDWIHHYLNTDANNTAFSEGLKLFNRYYLGPIKMPLTSFKRCCGPELHMKWQVDRDGFEKRVSSLQKSIERDNDMPPLIIQYSYDGFELNDGNHRYEAYVRSGYNEVDVIIWITEKSDYDLFLEKYGNYLDSIQNQ
jgi:hypothetical protein